MRAAELQRRGRDQSRPRGQVGQTAPRRSDDKGHTFFAELTAGRTGRELVFLHDDGKACGPSHQQRSMDAASARAKVEPAATFHILRHT